MARKEIETAGDRMTSTTQQITTSRPSFSTSVSEITLDNASLEDAEQSHNYTFPFPAKYSECANRRLSKERFLAEFSSSVSAITLDNASLEGAKQSHNYTFPVPAKDSECANRRLSKERFLAEFSSSVSAITLDNASSEDAEQSHNYTFPVPAKYSECANRKLSKERFLAEQIESTKILPLRVPTRRFLMTLCQTLGTDAHDSNLNEHPEKRQPPSKSPSAPKMPLRKESFHV
jgi:hypothetical protein